MRFTKSDLWYLTPNSFHMDRWSEHKNNYITSVLQIGNVTAVVVDDETKDIEVVEIDGTEHPVTPIGLLSQYET